MAPKKRISATTKRRRAVASSLVTSDTRPELTAEQVRFAMEYVRRMDPVRSFCVAFDVDDVVLAVEQSALLLADPAIAALIVHLRSQRAERTQWDLDRVMAELTPIATSSVKDYRVDESTGELYLAPGVSEEAWGSVASVKHDIIRRTYGHGEDAEEEVTHRVELRLYSRPDAIAMIGKLQGLFVTRIGDPDGRPLDLNALRAAAAAAEAIDAGQYAPDDGAELSSPGAE